MENCSTHGWRNGIFWGGILILIGTLLILDNDGFIDSAPIWHYWPFILVAFGVNKIVGFRKPKHIASGFWLIFLGLWLFASIEHIWGLAFYNSWPLVLIGWGLTIIVKDLIKTYLGRLEAHHE